MAQAKVVEQIAAPVDRVFSQLGNFAGIKPGPGLESVDWVGSFDPKGVEDAQAVKFACAIYGNAIKGARAALDA